MNILEVENKNTSSHKVNSNQDSKSSRTNYNFSSFRPQGQSINSEENIEMGEINIIPPIESPHDSSVRRKKIRRLSSDLGSMMNLEIEGDQDKVKQLILASVK